MTAIEKARVIVGVDTSLAGLQALRSAVSEARLRGVELLAVRAWVYKSVLSDPDVSRWHAEFAQTAVATLRDAFDLAMGGVPVDTPVRFVVNEGSPRDVLLAYANRAGDMLVLGCGRRSRFWRPGRGGTARYCASHARCQVLIVPPPEMALAPRPFGLGRALRRETEEFTRAHSQPTG